MWLQSGGDQVHLFLGLGSSFQVPAGCWRNSVPCGFRIEIPSFLLAVSLGYSQVLEAICSPSPLTAPPHSQPLPHSGLLLQNQQENVSLQEGPVFLLTTFS